MSNNEFNNLITLCERDSAYLKYEKLLKLCMRLSFVSAITLLLYSLFVNDFIVSNANVYYNPLYAFAQTQVDDEDVEPLDLFLEVKDVAMGRLLSYDRRSNYHLALSTRRTQNILVLTQFADNYRHVCSIDKKDMEVYAQILLTIMERKSVKGAKDLELKSVVEVMENPNCTNERMAIMDKTALILSIAFILLILSLFLVICILVGKIIKTHISLSHSQK